LSKFFQKAQDNCPVLSPAVAIQTKQRKLISGHPINPTKLLRHSRSATAQQQMLNANIQCSRNRRQIPANLTAAARLPLRDSASAYANQRGKPALCQPTRFTGRPNPSTKSCNVHRARSRQTAAPRES
jgi:hypothetical protein